MKRLLCTLLAGMTLLILAGCGSVFARDYYYETPFSGDFGTRSDRATEIRNYSMLKTALTNMITSRAEKGEFRFSSYNGNVSEDLAAACFEIKSDHPLGAYAVETLSYDTSYVVSYYVANIYISYKRSAEELNSIVYTSNTLDFDDRVCRAMDSYEPGLVIRCFAPGIDETYIRTLVRRHYFDDPVLLAAEPAAEVTSYPTDGPNSIYDIQFKYGLSRQRSETMSAAVTERLEADVEEMTETEQPKLALEGALLLSSRCADGDPTGIYADSAYGALVLGNADSKGLALAYRALCAALDIECIVVEGGFGSMGTETHFWNIITLDGDSYHVDVSAMAESPADAFLLSDEMLWGRCIWDTEQYPACGGPLRYAEVAGIPEQNDAEQIPEEPTPDTEPEEPLAPEETQTPQDEPRPVEPTPERGDADVPQTPEPPEGNQEKTP